jgi:hypothetical protein
MGKTRIVTHFTDLKGLEGITGLVGESLLVGQAITLNVIRFGRGTNSFNALRPGDIFVTELGPDATDLQLVLIGVRGAKKQFALSFSDQDAFESGARVEPSIPESGIFVIPSGVAIQGRIEVVRRY